MKLKRNPLKTPKRLRKAPKMPPSQELRKNKPRKLSKRLKMKLRKHKKQRIRLIELLQPKSKQIKKRLKLRRTRLIWSFRKSVKLRHYRRLKPNFKLKRMQMLQLGLR